MIDWAELATLTAEVHRLQGRRQAAGAKQDLPLMKAISRELERAMYEREALLSQIALRIGVGPSPASAESDRDHATGTA
jgi:hypothetical protein